MRDLRHAAVAIVAASLLLLGLLFGYATLRGHPEDLPWTKLDLSQPVGLFTARKMAALRKDFPGCRALMDRAGVRYTVLPAISEGRGACGYADGLRFAEGGARRIAFAPARLGISCPVAAALSVWEWQVVQPAAQRHFGAQVTRIEHLGSYNCRRIGNRSAGDWSEHATANAVDVAGFRLSDGTHVTVLRDWKGQGEKAAFLREVRAGACRLFSTVLSPDYNAAHRDHLHLDEAERGEMGWRACR
jgi:hypothetical protein